MTVKHAFRIAVQVTAYDCQADSIIHGRKPHGGLSSSGKTGAADPFCVHIIQPFRVIQESLHIPEHQARQAEAKRLAGQRQIFAGGIQRAYACFPESPAYVFISNQSKSAAFPNPVRSWQQIPAMAPVNHPSRQASSDIKLQSRIGPISVSASSA